MNATTKNTTANTTATTFETLKRTFETDRQDADALYSLSTAIAYSVLKKCIDPQRKAAQEAATVSNSGHNPALLALKQGIGADRRALASLDYCTEKATRQTYSADGDRTTEIADRAAFDALNNLVNETLSDGLDLVQTAALALLEQAAEHADSGAEWLDAPRISVR